MVGVDHGLLGSFTHPGKKGRKLGGLGIRFLGKGVVCLEQRNRVGKEAYRNRRAIDQAVQILANLDGIVHRAASFGPEVVKMSRGRHLPDALPFIDAS